MSAALNRPTRNMPTRKQQRVIRLPNMPLDVVAVILAYLPQADLRRASTASQTFYQAAHIAGLELHVNLETLNAYSLMNFILVIRHALAHRVQFKLALTLLVVWREAERVDFQSSLLNTLAAIRSAMPRLVSLRATFAGHFAEAVYGGLAESAPLLRELEFFQTDALPVPIPPTLFAGNAPRLHVLTLDIPTLKPVWPHVPALDHVRALTIRLGHKNQRFVVPRFFHNLQELTVVSKRCRDNDGAAVIDISGMTLQRLTVDNDARRLLQFHAPGAKIAAVEYMLKELQYDEQLWPADACELQAHVQSNHKLDVSGMDTGSVVAISSTDGTWRHTQYTPLVISFVTTLTPLVDLPPLSTRLVSLTVDEGMLPELMGTTLILAALRELFVDCTRPRKAPPIPARELEAYDRVGLPLRRLRCPALPLVAAFATNPARVVLSCSKLVTLGQMLVPARAALVLVRVKVDLEKHREALEKVFSSVTMEGPDQRWVPGYYHPRHYDPRKA
ncbi:hypothetical protein AURDEDRAFT_163751 [Auricularia subglabra TFB-10046 SS5]|nr:hypothetical protein AURDEDRAFT_163751 [Auricularia subglabra TFB-10046 SS5]